MFFKDIQGKIVQVVELVFLEITDNMDQVAENGAGACYVGNDEIGRNVFTL